PNGGKIIIRSENFSREGAPFQRIIIFDNGHGIPREAQSKLFRPFFTTKPNGTGSAWQSFKKSSFSTAAMWTPSIAPKAAPPLSLRYLSAPAAQKQYNESKAHLREVSLVSALGGSPCEITLCATHSAWLYLPCFSAYPSAHNSRIPSSLAPAIPSRTPLAKLESKRKTRQNPRRSTPTTTSSQRKPTYPSWALLPFNRTKPLLNRIPMPTKLAKQR